MIALVGLMALSCSRTIARDSTVALLDPKLLGKAHYLLSHGNRENTTRRPVQVIVDFGEDGRVAGLAAVYDSSVRADELERALEGATRSGESAV